MHTVENRILTCLTIFILWPKLGDLVQLVRGGLSKMQQAVLSALIVIEVHAKDVVAKLVEQEVSSINDFEWISQLRLSICLVLHFFHFLLLPILILESTLSSHLQ